MKRMLMGLLMLAAGSLLAGTATWKGGASAFWNDADNWTGDCANGYPSTGDTAVFDDAAGGSVRIEAAGVSVAKIMFKQGAWTLLGGTLTVSDATPFPYVAEMQDPVTFECPVYFSSTAVKYVYGGKTYHNAITCGGSNRLFFCGVAGATDFQRTHRLEGPGCVVDLTNVPNVAAGTNDNKVETAGNLVVCDGALLRAKIFFGFLGSVTTVSNASLTTTTGGTGQSFDLCSPCSLVVQDGGLVNIAGKFDIGQSKTAGIVSVRIEGGTVKANQTTVTRTQTNVDIVFAKTVEGTMGQLQTGSWGTIKDSSTFGFSIEDAAAAEPGTSYGVLTDASQARGTDGYAALRYNGSDATVVGDLAVRAGRVEYTLREADFTWTGAAGDDKLSTAANWYCQRTPVGGESLLFKNLPEATVLENDLVDFAPASITIQSTCTGGLTFTGNPFVNVAEIVNQSPRVPVFETPVFFADKINLRCAEANVDFIGGVTGTDPARLCPIAMTLQGNYTLTKSTDEGTSWKPTTDMTFVVPAGSVLNIPGTNYLHNSLTKFVVEEGATMNVGTIIIRDANEHFLVKGTLNVGDLRNAGFTPTPFFADSTGVVNAERVGQGANNPSSLTVARLNVGAGGLVECSGFGGAATQAHFKMTDGQVLGASADWIYQAGVESTGYHLDIPGALVLDTTDCNDGVTPRTIRFEGPVTGGGRVAVIGSGMFDLSAYTAAFAVGGSLAPAAGTTLRVNAFGTLDEGLELPATGVVNLRLVSSEGVPRGVALKLFANTGLDATAPVAERLAVTMEGHDAIKGVLSVTAAGDVLWTVTESDTAAATLLWRPGETAAWDLETPAWQDAAGAACAFLPYSTALFDGAEEGSGEIVVAADVTVGAMTFTGEKDYTLTGSGKLVGNERFAVCGGTVTLNGAELTYQPIAISNAILRVGEQVTPTTLGTAPELTIYETGALDVNQVGSNVTNESIHCKAITLCGSGPDGLGALRNSTCATPTPYLLSELHFTGDTTIGGPGRLDLRPLASSQRGKTADTVVFEGPDTATLTVTGQLPASNWGFNLNNCPNATIGRIVVDAGIMTIDAGTVLRCPGGVTVKNGGIFYCYGLTKEQSFDVTVGEGDGEFRCANGSVTTTGKIVVPAGATLKMSGTMTHLGEVENYGTIQVTGGTVKFLGPVTGDGVFSGVRIENWPSSADATFNLTGTTSFAAPGFALDGGTLNVRGTFTAPSATVNPVLNLGTGTINLTGNLSANGARPTIGWGTTAGDELTVNLGGYNFTCNVPLSGASDVHLVGPGAFTSDSGWQNALEGHWTVDVGDSLCNLSGASAFRAGLTLGERAQVQLNIGGGGTRAVESLVLTRSSWEEAKAYTGDYPQFVTHLKMLHVKSDAPAISTVAYYYRGKFLVPEDQAGTWYFGGVFDDRLLLEIDGGAVLETTGAAVPSTGSCNLKAGWHAFRVVAWDNTGNQGPTHGDWTGKMALGWATAEPAEPLKASSYNRFDTSTLAMRPLSTMWLSHTDTNNNTTWKEFEDWSSTAITNTLTGINHYGEDSEASLFNSHLNKLFGKFYITDEQAGTWTLRGRYDDQLLLKIDGEQVLEVKESASKPTATYEATAGWHDFEIRTNDGTGHFGPADQSAAILITFPGASAEVPFDESTFDFTTRDLDDLPVPGLFGDVVLGAEAQLLNGSAFGTDVYKDAFCPIYGSVFGPGTLVSNFRFLGGRLGVAGDGRAPAVPAFGEGSRADTLAELGGVDCRFASRPVFERILLGPALGLTAERAQTLPVTVAIDGLSAAAGERYARTMRLLVADDQLWLVNPLGASTIIVFR